MARFPFKPSNTAAGFSLVETIVATSLLAGVLIGAAQLFVIAIRANQGAQKSTFASTLAVQKMEQLRGLAWGFESIGNGMSVPISDFTTNLTVSPATNDGMGLRPSPDNALSANVAGYVDYVDRFGNSLGGGLAAPAGTVYVRRWSVEPLPTNPNDTLILQVAVFSLGDRPAGDSGDVLGRVRDDARITSVKTRKSR